MAKLSVLYRDKDLIAVHKPSGLAVYSDTPGKGEASCFDLMKKRVGEGHTIYPVHRLDKGTCGVLLFALRPDVAQLLQREFTRDRVKKTYWAICFGTVPAKGEINQPLTQNKTGRSQAAKTTFKRLGLAPVAGLEEILPDDPNVSWLELHPQTGRYHQIRRHLRGAEHPILGDAEYSGRVKLAWALKQYNLRRMALSAVELKFQHPTQRKPMVIQTFPDPAVLKLMETLGFEPR